VAEIVRKFGNLNLKPEQIKENLKAWEAERKKREDEITHALSAI